MKNLIANIFLGLAVLIYAYDWSYGVIRPERAFRRFLIVQFGVNPAVAFFGSIALVLIGIVLVRLTLNEKEKKKV